MVKEFSVILRGLREDKSDYWIDKQKSNTDPNVELTDMPDGGAEVNFDPNAPIDHSQIPFEGNLADYIEETDLQRFASELIGNYESDRFTRKDWEDTYIKGLDMLGFKYEERTQPFEGSSGSANKCLYWGRSSTCLRSGAVASIPRSASPSTMYLGTTGFWFSWPS